MLDCWDWSHHKRLALGDHEIVRLLKGAYGRADAPLLWFKELEKGLKALGFKPSPFDPCCYALADESGRTIGLIGVHVDDGLCCGNEKFHMVLKDLEKQYPFGSKKSKDFVFTGLRIKQAEDFSITVDQTEYIKDITPIGVTTERRKQQTENVTEEERQQLRGIIGSLQYASTNTRPDLGSRLSYLQSRINSATVETLLDANRTLHEAKANANVALKIQPIAVEDLRFICFSDAAFASEKNPSSHQGMILMTAHRDIEENKSSIINPIMWSSKKSRKLL